MLGSQWGGCLEGGGQGVSELLGRETFEVVELGKLRLLLGAALVSDPSGDVPREQVLVLEAGCGSIDCPIFEPHRRHPVCFVLCRCCRFAGHLQE